MFTAQYVTNRQTEMEYVSLYLRSLVIYIRATTTRAMCQKHDTRINYTCHVS